MKKLNVLTDCDVCAVATVQLALPRQSLMKRTHSLGRCRQLRTVMAVGSIHKKGHILYRPTYKEAEG